MKQLLICSMIVFLAACKNHDQHQQKPDAFFDIGPVKSHILEMNKTYSKRFTTNDSLFYVERYCRDAEVYCPSLPAVRGREAIRRFFYGNGSNTETVIELPAGNFYGNDQLVVEEGSYHFPDGKGGSVDKGKFMAIWKKEDGQWKMYREIWNSDLPPAK
jgi:ketosteroid isomerase-like protein